MSERFFINVEMTPRDMMGLTAVDDWPKLARKWRDKQTAWFMDVVRELRAEMDECSGLMQVGPVCNNKCDDKQAIIDFLIDRVPLDEEAI